MFKFVIGWLVGYIVLMMAGYLDHPGCHVVKFAGEDFIIYTITDSVRGEKIDVIDNKSDGQLIVLRK